MKTRSLTAVLILSGLLAITSESHAWNQAPVAKLVAIREYVIVGGRAIVDGNDPCEPSYDPDGYITKYEWDFDYTGTFNCDYYETSSYYPDGAFDGRTMSFVYDSEGTYTVALRVTDDGSPGLTDIDDCDVYVGPDADNDGLPADWEELYDFNDANFADADQNYDGDSFNNLCEYLHGSEPNDSSSVPNPNFPITIYVPSDVNSIQRAINAAIDGDTIVVSEGTYYEAIDFNSVSCILTSTDPNDWDVVAGTIVDANNPNAYVVTFENSEDVNSVLRGFTITGGYRGIHCHSTSPTITNCTITDNGTAICGGGMYCRYSASPTITNCIFSGNTASWYGGGMYNFDYSSPTVINCVFSKNHAIGGGDYGGYGGGMANYTQSSPTLINCTFSGNVAHIYDSNGGYGGGIYNRYSEPNITNCIFWGNEAEGSGDEIYNFVNTYPYFSYCDIRGGLNGPHCGGPNSIDGGDNIDSDPCLLDASDPAGPDGVFGTLDDGLRLQTNSPCIETGDPNTDSNDVGTVDLVGYDRFMDGDDDGNDVIDIGAYELPLIWFVDEDANGSNDGNSWEDARIDLQDALDDANDGDEIWVAEGTYKPDDVNNRSVSFELVEGVGVYGGFAGTEVGRHQRDWTLHVTILSGDIGEPDDQNDNSYHVVKGADNAVLDGFTITGGDANTSSPDNVGGGIYCSSTSPTIVNCTITNNNSSSFGGGMYSNSASPIVTDCFFTGNSSGEGAGMSCNGGASPTVSNCTFSENAAGFWGGGVSNEQNSNPTLTNCTFSGNESWFGGGGMFNYSSNPTLTNCIFWADTPDEIYNYSSTPIVTYCDIEGGYYGTGNINSDPCFADVNNPAGADGVFGTYDDGLRLLAKSPCIDAADGDASPREDILGLDRIDINDVTNTGTGDPNYVDIGVYESYAPSGGLDSDGDGMPDDWEILNGLNPNDANDANWDLDGDGLSNLLEYQIGTWANSDDTDSDGMKDGWEYTYGFNPLDSADADQDADKDGKDNLEEHDDGSNPIIYNTISVIVYVYDNAGQVTKETVQDGDGNNVTVTEYQYDELGRRWQQRRWADVAGSDDANDMINLYSYDVRSNLKETVRKVDPNAIAVEPNDLLTENFYDSLGRLTDVNDSGGGNTHYTYYKGGEPNQVTDPNGNTTTNYYDNAGRLEKVTDAEDHYRLYYYDSLSRTIKQIVYDCNSTPYDANDDFALMQTRFEYNGLGNVTRRAVMADADSTGPIYDSNDIVVDYNYPADGNGLLMDETMYYAGDTAATTYYGYDGLGRRTDITDPGGNLTLLYYDEVGQIIRRQQIDDDPLGSNDLTITADYYYDSLSRVRHHVAKPDVNDSNTWQTTTYDYDALGNRIQETTPNSVLITYSYNALAHLVEKIADYGTGKINQKTEYGYDRLSRQTSITGYADGSTAQTTNYTYDKLDRITNVEYPDGNDIDFEYNPAGRVVKRIDQRGIVTTYDYDATYNMLTKSVDGNSITDDANEIFTYDGLGRTLTASKEVAAQGTISETEFAYNDIGKITDADETYFADSNTTKTIIYTYDQAGHPNSIDYPDGSTINITPDWQGRIDTVKLSSTTIATYEYIGSRVAQRSYPIPGITYQPSYDNLGRITSADSNTSYAKFDYEYAVNTNNISQQTYVHRDVNNPPATDFYYDNLDRLTTAEYGIQSEDEVFTMDDLGNREKVNARDGNDVAYTVDNLTNRYDSVREYFDAVGYWEMDDNDANTKVIDSSGNDNDGTASKNTTLFHTDTRKTGTGAFEFDGDGDYVNIGNDSSLKPSLPISVSMWIEPNSLVTYQWLISNDRYPGSNYYGIWAGIGTANQIAISYGDGGYSGPSSRRTKVSASTVSLNEWQHIAFVIKGATDMDIYINGTDAGGTYSGTGGALAYSTGDGTIGSYGGTTYFIDAIVDDVMMCDKALSADEVKALYNSACLSYDEAGNSTRDRDGYEYEYDYENRIVKITKDSSDIAEFAYDAFGRRIRKIDSVANETTLYYHNYNWQVLAEYDGSNNLQRKFIYGNYIDEVLLMKADGNDYYYAHDHLYSPAALIDSSGTVQERYEYDAYGNCSILEPNFAPDPDGKSDYGNPYLFTGRRLDIMDSGSLKIQYNRNRYYDYYTGRWLTYDPLGYVDGMNLYEYVRSNPVIRADAQGTISIIPIWDVGKIIGNIWAVGKAVCPDCTGGLEDRTGEPRPPGAWEGETEEHWKLPKASCPKCGSNKVKKKPTLKRKCSCHISGHYYTDRVKPHEEDHVELIKNAWKSVQFAAGMYTLIPCVCQGECACYARAFDLYMDAMQTKCRLVNFELDCKVEPDEKKRIDDCKSAERLRRRYEKEIIDFKTKVKNCRYNPGKPCR